MQIFLFWGIQQFLLFPQFFLTCYINRTGMCMPSHVRLSATPWTVACQAPLSAGFYRQEYWSRLPFPSPGDLPDQGLNLCLLSLLRWQVDGCSLALSVAVVSTQHPTFKNKKQETQGFCTREGSEGPCFQILTSTVCHYQLLSIISPALQSRSNSGCIWSWQGSFIWHKRPIKFEPTSVGQSSKGHWN